MIFPESGLLTILSTRYSNTSVKYNNSFLLGEQEVMVKGARLIDNDKLMAEWDYEKNNDRASHFP